MKIEKLHRNTWNKSGTKYREEMIFDKLGEIIDQLEKQEQLNKIFSERLGLDPDDDRSKPDKLQRLLEWVDEHITYPDEKEILLAKIKSLINEE